LAVVESCAVAEVTADELSVDCVVVEVGIVGVDDAAS
jgi:folylpolyglutamate synthase/dihydropteroate synthase